MKNTFLSEKKPQRVETDLSEENAVKYSHPPSSKGNIMDHYFLLVSNEYHIAIM